MNRNIELPGITSFFWRQSRRKTFDKWPFNESNKCNADCMAAAGFYVIGNNDEPDLVACFICNKQLDGWEPNDDPWNEHVKHNPTCPFVKLNKQDEKAWTVGELYDLYKKYTIKEYMEEINKDITTLKDAVEQLKSELSVNKISQKNKKSTD
ncbi:hypothetical protein P5V15_000754 [Pogonomyrmex californicus]